MERNFLGMSSNGFSVKEEIDDGCNDLASARSSAMQWTFSNKVSALPQVLSFTSSQEDWPKKTVYDSHALSGAKSALGAFDSDPKLFSSSGQKNLISERNLVGSHYSMTAYPSQHHDTNSANRPHDVKTYPVPAQPKQLISTGLNVPIFQSYPALSGQSFTGSAINQLPLAGAPIATPISIIPSATSISYTSDQRCALKPFGAPAQMTIFYNGLVSVYNDVPHEKAQAIMLLAGNGPSASTPGTAPSTSQAQAPILNTSTSADVFTRNQSHASSSCLPLSSPASSSLHTVTPLGSGSAGNKEIEAKTPVGSLASPIKPPNVVSSHASNAPTLVPSAVPQSRKASLARFLEKRKERVTAAAMPYNFSKKSPDCSTLGSNGHVSLLTNSAGCSPLPATN